MVMLWQVLLQQLHLILLMKSTSGYFVVGRTALQSTGGSGEYKAVIYKII